MHTHTRTHTLPPTLSHRTDIIFVCINSIYLTEQGGRVLPALAFFWQFVPKFRNKLYKRRRRKSLDCVYISFLFLWTYNLDFLNLLCELFVFFAAWFTWWTIKPLYLKDSNIRCSDDNRITDFESLDCVSQVVRNSLHCLQLDRNLWRDYLSDIASRQKLLTAGIHFQNFNFCSVLRHLPPTLQVTTVLLKKKHQKLDYVVFPSL